MTNLKYVDNKEWNCNTCIIALRHDNIPRSSIANIMEFPVNQNNLNCSPHKNDYHSMHANTQLSKGGQYCVNGNVVNVPVDVQPTGNALRRRMEQSGTISVKMKKKVAYTTCDFSEHVL